MRSPCCFNQVTFRGPNTQYTGLIMHAKCICLLAMSLGGIVARNIRRLRLERGLTQEELAARIRINRNYVGMIERQENSPTVEVLERIAKALGIEPARLFDEKAAGRKAE